MAADVTLNAGSGGAIIATDPTTSSEHYQLIKLAQGAVGTFTLVTSANAFPVVIGSSFQGGIISLSSQIAVTATGPVTITSGTVTLSSVHTVTATGPVTVSSGLISVTSGTITSTSATNPWSSAPGFNVPVVSVSSGLVQLSGTPTVLSASSGFIQSWPAVTPTSSVAGANLGPVTSSAGQLVNVSSGTISLSSQITVTATGPVTITSGTVTLSSQLGPWSSAPGFNVPIVSVSSGLVQVSGTPLVNVVGTSSGVAVVTTSGGLVVSLSSTPPFQSTAATSPWSSAPGFNVPVVNVSSGLVQALGVVAASSGAPAGLAFANNITTGGVALGVNVKGTPGLWFGYTIYNSTAALRSIKIYNTTSAPAIGSTASIVSYLPAPGSTGGGGSNMIFPYGVFCSNGIGYTITANPAATDTGAPGTNDVSFTLYYV